jgi:hypothetical protein
LFGCKQLKQPVYRSNSGQNYDARKSISKKFEFITPCIEAEAERARKECEAIVNRSEDLKMLALFHII